MKLAQFNIYFSRGRWYKLHLTGTVKTFNRNFISILNWDKTVNVNKFADIDKRFCEIPSFIFHQYEVLVTSCDNFKFIQDTSGSLLDMFWWGWNICRACVLIFISIDLLSLKWKIWTWNIYKKILIRTY